MQYKNENFHDECFCCCSCGTEISKKSFVDRPEGYFCEQCYEDKLATKCNKCCKVRGVRIADSVF